MPTATPNIQTIVIVVVFATVYMLVVLRKTLYGKVDLYDFFMLSMVAIVPATFVLFPDVAWLLSRASGVTFPFVLMFGALLLVVFVFMHRMTGRFHKLERQNCVLVQELSLLALELAEAKQIDRIET